MLPLAVCPATALLLLLLLLLGKVVRMMVLLRPPPPCHTLQQCATCSGPSHSYTGQRTPARWVVYDSFVDCESASGFQDLRVHTL